MQAMNREERFYRGLSQPSDLQCFEVRLKETDLFCCTSCDVRDLIQNRVVYYRHQLEEYINKRPEFLHSLLPLDPDPLAPQIAKQMINASSTVGVGPMACVAGAVAEFVGRDIDSLCEEFIIENGGDIQMRTKKERLVLIYAKDSPFSNKLGMRLKARAEAYGICTSSGTVGHSLSFGRADAVCILASSALFADGLATRVGNMVSSPGDIPAALEVGKAYADVIGILIIIGDKLGVWGDVDLTKV
jgi:uncharacterized protein